MAETQGETCQTSGSRGTGQGVSSHSSHSGCEPAHSNLLGFGGRRLAGNSHTPPAGHLLKNLKADLGPRVFHFVYNHVPHSEKSLGSFPIAPFPSRTRTPVFFLHRAYLCLRQVPPLGPVLM